MLSAETNYAHVEIDLTGDISSFLEQVDFPSHALIVKSNKPVYSTPFVSKGIVDKQALQRAIVSAAEHSFDGRVLVQTDMRAHLNPTRMKVIHQLAIQFVEKLKTLCPSCNAPGFGRVDVERGLPCSFCATPTRWVKVEIFGCELCGFREARARSDGLRTTGQESCPTCNP